MIGVSVWFSQPSPEQQVSSVVTEAPVAPQIAPIVKAPEALIVPPPPVPQFQATTATPSVSSETKTMSFASIFHKNSGNCLDGNGIDKAYINSCNDGLFQKWDSSNGSLVQRESKKCLDSDGKNLYMNDCNATQFQAWTKDSNTYKHGQTGLCLDSDGKSLYLTSCDTANEFQKWTDIAPTTGSLIGGIQSIGTALKQ
jgi:Ricin-type beta-trefoil lectin domain